MPDFSDSRPSAEPSPDRIDALRAKVAGLLPGVLDDLAALARIPSVSMRSFDAGQVQASAERVAQLLTGVGMDVEIVREGDGHPAVIGELAGPVGAPRVLLYAHHDVQPPGDEADWDSAPFEPTRRGDRLFGRGTADDKAGVLAHVGALRAHDGAPPVSVVVFVEGEEEVGSESLPAFLARYADRLACDAIVIADSSNWAVGTPALTTTLRGNVRVDVTVSTLDHGIHSGMFGGPVPDGITTLCRLLGTLHTPQGDLAVAGLDTHAGFDLDYPNDQLRADAGMLPGVQVIGTGRVVDRLWGRPSLTVIGIDAPAVDVSANLLSPSCRARLSLRTAPSQDPQAAFEALRDHLVGNAPWGADVRVDLVDLGAGFTTPTGGPVVDAARAALTDAWGAQPVDMGMGGSIPFIAQFAEAFPDAGILVTGVEDPDTRAHGANESLHVPEFERACLAEAILLERLGGLRHGDPSAPRQA